MEEVAQVYRLDDAADFVVTVIAFTEDFKGKVQLGGSLYCQHDDASVSVNFS